MHELALMAEVCDLAAAAAAAEGAQTIHRLHLRIGAQAGVDAYALRAAFAVVSSDPTWASTLLQLDVVPTRCFCSNCAQAFHPDDVIHACPDCGAMSSQLLEGRELELVALEVS